MSELQLDLNIPSTVSFHEWWEKARSACGDPTRAVALSAWKDSAAVHGGLVLSRAAAVCDDLRCEAEQKAVAAMGAGDIDDANRWNARAAAFYAARRQILSIRIQCPENEGAHDEGD